MRFTIATAKMAEALTTVTRALSSRTTHPILDGTLLETGSQHM